MVKEILAVVLLIAVLGATIFHSKHIDTFIGELIQQVDISEAQTKEEDYEGAAKELHKAIDRWRDAKPYTSVMIHHAETDAATNTFYDLLSYLYAREGDAALGTFEKLRVHLENISYSERLSLGSVF